MKRLAHATAAIGLAAFCLFPILWGVRTSFAPALEKNFLPARLTTEHYEKILSRPDFYRYAANSLLLTLGTLLVVIPLALMAGYALARHRFWGRQAAPLLLALPLLPVVTFLVPIASYLHVLGLYDTRLALVLANAAFALPFAIWMVWNFVHAIPNSIEEAAFLDGCSRLQALVHVVLPSMIPGAIAASVFVAVQTWSNYLFAFALTSDMRIRVLPHAIVEFIGLFSTDLGGLTAIGILALLPPLIVFQALQKWFIAGAYGMGRK